MLFDCGEGTQRQMMRYGVGFSFTEVFFTHFHADHMLGIIGLLRTMGLQDRTAPVTLYGPRGADRILTAAMSLGIERNKFPVDRRRGAAGDRLRRDEYDIVVFETEHRADTVGYALAEHTRLGPVSPRARARAGRARGAALGPAPQGRDRARWTTAATVSPEDLVGAPRGGAPWCIRATRGPHLPLLEAARGADLLIHEATFGGDEAERAVETGHSDGVGGRARGARGRRAAARADAHQPALHPRRAGAAGGGARGVSGDDDRAGRDGGGGAVRGVR